MRIQEDRCCPKCDTIYCRRSVLMLQRNLLHLSYTFMMEAGSFSEMMVHSHHTTWHHILEDSNLHSHCHENLKSHMIMLGIFWKKKKRTWYHNKNINKIWCSHANECNDGLLGCDAVQFGNISKELAVSIFRTEESLSSRFLQNFAPTYQTTQRHIPLDQNLDNFSHKKQHSLIKTASS